MRLNNTFSLTIQLTLLFVSLNIPLAFSQYQIDLRSGSIQPVERVQLPGVLPEEISENHYIRIVQFFRIPNRESRKSLEDAGWRFLRYLSGSAYLIALPAETVLSYEKERNIRSVLRYQSEQKIDPQLLESPLPEWAMANAHQILVNIIGCPGTAFSRASEDLKAMGVMSTSTYKHYPFFKVAVGIKEIKEIASLPWVEWIELTSPPSTPDDDPARALHRSNMLDGNLSGGLHFTGAGVRTLVRDDGRIPPHPDFKGRLVDLGDDDDFFFGGGTHGDQVAGVVGGAGNIDPRYRGMAIGATLYNINYEPEFTDTTLDLHLNDNVVITNSSYSNGCTSGYNFGAFNVDLQLYEHPTLMHIFSAGNSNGSNCGYGAGNQWANVTGGHKIAKNCIAVANLFADGTLVNSSSRGPSLDGRLKPELSANGQDQITAYPDNTYEAFGGTSAAAPGVAGVMAQLYEAYRSLNAQADPPAALVKALLLNSATDLGNPGPDYRFGWGHVNGWQAWKDLDAQRYLEGQVDHQEIWTQQLEIPQNMASVKVMLYWADPPAFAGAEQVLVNDLDLVITTPDSTIIRPLVLRTEPNPNLLNMPASPGRDSLNNAEQIVLAMPTPGNYTITVSGYNVPMGDQSFFLTWHFESADELEVIWPHGGESIAAEDSIQYIHWETPGTLGEFSLEFSPDSGVTWNPVGTAEGHERIFQWIVPQTVTGQGLMRISRDNVTGQSAAPFSIASSPDELTPVMICPDSIVWSWHSLPYATSYEFHGLGSSYMETLGISDDTLFAVSANFPYHPESPDWFAVSAIGPDNLKSLRSVAIPFAENDLLNCTEARDLSLKGFVSPASSDLSLCSTLEEGLQMIVVNTGNAPATAVLFSYQLNEEPIVSELFTDTLQPNDTLVFQFSQSAQITAGEDSTITGWLEWSDDEFAYNDTIPLLRFTPFVYGPSAQLPVQEDFTGAETQLPDQWRILNPDSLLTWAARTVTQADGKSGTVMFVDNYAYSTAENEEDLLISTKIELPTTGNLKLSFDYAYTYYNDVYWDAFRVDLSTDCGNTFPHLLFEAAKDDLATAPPASGSFTPQKNDWKRVFADLSQFAGQEVIVRFANISGYGNQMYLDNVNIASLEQPDAAVGNITAPVCEQVSVDLTDFSTGNFLDYQWLLPNGVTIASDTPDENGVWQLQFQSEGNYLLQLVVANPLGSDTTAFEIEVLPQPSPAFDYTVDGLEVAFSNNSQDADSFVWDFGDGQGSELENPVHEYAMAGNYDVQLTAINTCGERWVNAEIETVTASTEVSPVTFTGQISPNPTAGHFRIVLHRPVRDSEISIALTDLLGRVHDMPLQILRGSTGEVTIDVDAHQLSPGIYLVTLLTPGGQFSGRVSIVR